MPSGILYTEVRKESRGQVTVDLILLKNQEPGAGRIARKDLELVGDTLIIVEPRQN